jgi:hypothetical protein
MMRNTEVPQVMTLVEAALLRASASPGRQGPIFVTPDGEGDMDISRLRHRAMIRTDVPSGSDRPGVGAAIVLAKRAVRRGLRWYLNPPFEQQSEFNHAVLDLFERARLENERLRNELDLLRQGQPGPAPQVAAVPPTPATPEADRRR